MINSIQNPSKVSFGTNLRVDKETAEYRKKFDD